VGAAALQRVPEIKAEDVQEVFFGNVLSAKLVPFFHANQDIATNLSSTALVKIQPDNAPSMPASVTIRSVQP
jgi:hypothetical protein